MTTADRPVVLVVDDDPGVRALCEAALGDEYEVVLAGDGREALRRVYARRPDVVLLDVTMPEMDGFEACRRIRDVADVPVIMLTAHGEDASVARGLDAGADDYVTKPFRPVPLLARIRAALRRPTMGGAGGGTGEAGGGGAPGPVPAPPRFSFRGGDLVVDAGRRLAVVRGEEVRLSATEYRLLELLARHAGQVLTHDQILERVWGHESGGEVGYVKTYVNLLRNKIERDPHNPEYLLARRGLGYLLEPRAPHDRAD